MIERIQDLGSMQAPGGMQASGDMQGIGSDIGNDRFDFSRNQTEFDNGQSQFNQGDMEDIMVALESALNGELPEAQAMEIISNFISIFGEEEFLRAKEVILGPAGEGIAPDEGLVEGPGTGTSDSVDAVIMDEGQMDGYRYGGDVNYSRKYVQGGSPQASSPGEPVRLSAGEYILPERTVRQVGGGNHGLGTLKLDRMLGKEISYG
jgi:hypothetical protein